MNSNKKGWYGEKHKHRRAALKGIRRKRAKRIVKKQLLNFAIKMGVSFIIPQTAVPEVAVYLSRLLKIPYPTAEKLVFSVWKNLQKY